MIEPTWPKHSQIHAWWISLSSQLIFDCIAQIYVITRCWWGIEFTSSIFTVGKICDEPLLEGIHHIFPNKVFSGSVGSNDYDNARFTRRGWCPSSSGSYLSLDLQKEYHITRVVVMGDSDQTKRSVSYSMRYSHNKTLVDTSLPIQVYLLSK